MHLICVSQQPASLLGELNLEWEGLATGCFRDWPRWKVTSSEGAGSFHARTLLRSAHLAAPLILEASQESPNKFIFVLSKLELVCSLRPKNLNFPALAGGGWGAQSEPESRGEMRLGGGGGRDKARA